LNRYSINNKNKLEKENKMKNFIVDYGTGVENIFNAEFIEDILDDIDETITYTNNSVIVKDENGREAARRNFNSVAYDENEDCCENPIDFGSFGFYDDWRFNY